jgi:RNA polymerase sigma-70 factor (ECF subfamily)
MASATIVEQAWEEGWSDDQVVSRVLAGDTALYELLMRRYNERLYRVTRAILRNDADAEDVMQLAHMSAYQHLADFEGRAKFSTWLTRIAMHEALARSGRRQLFQPLENSDQSLTRGIFPLASNGPSPEERAYSGEVDNLLEKAILGLHEDYRLVLILRDVQEMSTEETAECLNLSQENVKVRLHRAHAALRKDLYARTGATSVQSFHFHASRCNRIVKSVFPNWGFLSAMRIFQQNLRRTAGRLSKMPTSTGA